MNKQLFNLLSLILLTIGASSVLAEEVVGSLDGEIIVEQGSLNWTLPIDTPEGVNSLKPNLSLNYVGGIDGQVGLGFKIGGLPSISRCKASKYHDGYDGGFDLSKEGQFCLNGQRLLDTGRSDLNGIEYILAVDNGSKIYKAPSTDSDDRSGSWMVKTKEGEVLNFGETPDAKGQFVGLYRDYYSKVPGGPLFPSKSVGYKKNSTTWFLNRKSDNFGNEINYTYVNNSGYISVSEVSYDNKKVVFEYEQNSITDPITKYRGRSASRELNDRLKSIKVYPNYGTTFLHSYNLGYEEVSDNKYNRLKNIKLCSAEGNCVPPTTFKWTNSSEKQEQYSVDVVNKDDIKSYQFADITGNGLKDVCYLIDNGSSGASLKWDIECSVNTKSSDSSEYSYSAPKLWADVDFSITANGQKITTDFKLVDINNDQKADFCQARYDGLHCRLNEDTSFSSTEILLSDTNSKLSYLYRDLNSDGIVDVCKNDVVSASNSTFSCSLANSQEQLGYSNAYGHLGSMANFVEVTNLKNAWGHSADVVNSSIQIVDMNGDGISDYCGADSAGFKCHLGISRSEVAVSQSPDFVEETIKLQQDEKNSKSFRYTDLNNDGLPDVCFSELTDSTRRLYDLKCSINTGSSLLAPTVWKAIPQDVDISNIQIYDVNDDKYADLCLLDSTYDYSCAINEGNEFGNFERHLTVRAPYKKETEAENYVGFDSTVRVVDVAGDTQADVCYLDEGGIQCAIDKRIPLAQLASITTGYNNETSFEYDYLTNQNIYTPQAANNVYTRKVEGKYKVISAVNRPNGSGGKSTSKYTYKGLQVDWYQKKRSFNEITIINENDNRKVVKSYYKNHYMEENSLLMGKLSSNTSYYLTGAVNSGVYAVSKKLKSTNYSYFSKVSSRHPDAINILKLSETTKNYGNSNFFSGVVKTTTDVLYGNHDSYGNPKLITTEKSIGDYTGGVYVTEVEINYDNRVTGDDWILGLVDDKKTIHSITNDTSPKQRFYEDYEYGSSGELRSSQEILLPSNELGLKTVFDYDSQGRLLSTTLVGDSNNPSRKSQIFYDAEGRIDYQFNALNHKTQYDYSPGINYREQCSDFPSQIEDANGLITTLEYDDFCVKTKETSLGVVSIWNKEWLGQNDLGYNHPQTASFKTTESTQGNAPVSNYYDSLKRVVRVETKGFDGRSVFKDNVYDSQGRLERETNPYYEGEFAGDNTYWKTYFYDEFGRKVKIEDYTEEGGLRQTSYTYDMTTVIKTDANNNIKSTKYNANGEIWRVKEGNNISTVSYEYEPSGVLRYTNTNGKIVIIKYDEAGRKYQLMDHSIGATTYLYNIFGELKQTTDANNTVVEYTYNKLGQKTTQISTGSKQNVDNLWQYGTSKAKKEIGKIVYESSVTDSALVSEKNYEYDNFGRLKETTITTDGKPFKQVYTYDEYNRPASQTYPDGMKVEREYTEFGTLKSIKIPKNNVWDYDYSVLTQSLSKVKSKVNTLNASRGALVTKYQEYLTKAVNYRLVAQQYENQAEDLTDTIAQLQSAADQLESEAKEYKKKWDIYEALIDDVKDQICSVYGSGTSAWTSGEGCYIKNDSKSTADVSWFQSQMGGEAIHIKSDLVELVGLNIATTFVCMWCPQASTEYQYIDIGEFYTGLSNHYKSLYEIKDAEYNNKIASINHANGAYTTDRTDTTSFSQCKSVNVTNSKAELKKVIPEIANLKAGKHSIVPIMVGGITVMIPVPEEQITTRISTLESRKETLESNLLKCVIPTIKQNQNIAFYKKKSEEYTGFANYYFDKTKVETEKLRALEAELTDAQNSQVALQNSMQEYQDNGETHLTLWTATNRDALNRLSGEMTGNGLQTRRDYDYMTGQLKQIKTTALSTGATLREFDYEYDALSNVTRRNDVTRGIDESFGYDSLDRLDYASRIFSNSSSSDQGYSRNYSYDINGNLLNNGEHTVDLDYNETTNRLTKADGNSYSYDNNGNTVQSGNRHYTWTALDKPLSISQGNQSTTFAYDANHDRVKQTLSTSGNSRTTYYVGKSYEHIVDNGDLNNPIIQNKHYIYADGEVVAIQVRTLTNNGAQAKPDETRYLHKDNLGNVDTISDGSGAIIQQAIFDPFGKSTVTSTTLTEPWTNRGFTGHEELKEFGLVHMNGRIYDPEVGRFISADPLIQDPSRSQSFNRYAYVFNNPMKYVDPSGYYGEDNSYDYDGEWDSFDDADFDDIGDYYDGDGSWGDGDSSNDGGSGIPHFSVGLTENLPSYDLIGSMSGLDISSPDYLVDQPSALLIGAENTFNGAADTLKSFVDFVHGIGSFIEKDPLTAMAIGLGIIRGKKPNKADQNSAKKGLETRGVRPQAGTRLKPDSIPDNWRIGPSKSTGGVKYTDPKNPHNNVRVEQGVPDHPYTNSRSAHVRDVRNGQYVDETGRPVSGGRHDSAGHIPLDKYK